MAIGNRSNTGGGATYLSVSLGSIWQKKGYEKDDPNYAEEDYKIGEKSGTVKGLKFSYVEGFLQSVFFKENDYGEFMNVYIEDREEEKLYCLQLKVDKGWTAYNICKRMMVALMSLDKAKPFTVNVSGNKDEESGFLNVILWVSQDGKNLVLNPEADAEKFDENKQTEFPLDVLADVLEIGVPTKEERKVMSKKQKERAREDELEDLKSLIESKYLDGINKEFKAKQEKKDEADKGKSPSAVKKEQEEEKEVEVEEAEEDKAEPELTAKEKRLAEIKAKLKAKAKK